MYKETRPMLCEDGYSDEEIGITQRSKKYQYSHSASREKLLGAARIISAWPGHLSSTFNLWTLAMASLFIIVFVLYSSVAALSILPSQSTKAQQVFTNKKKSLIPVFMHIITSNDKDAQLSQYVFNIHSFIKDFPEFQYNLIVLYNDTVDPNIVITQTDNIYNNEITNNDNRIMSNINSDNVLNIQYLTLSKYLDGSPLFKYWRQLPNYFIPFMVRALSIWDKGGIAFDPNILLPHFPAVKYINKLAEIMERYGKSEENTFVNNNKRKNHSPPIKRLDNIRDIIDDMANNSGNNIDITQENIKEEESKVYNTKSHFTGRKYLNENNVLLNINYEQPIKFGSKYPVIINPNVTKSEITINKNSDLLNPKVADLSNTDTELKDAKIANTENYKERKILINNKQDKPNLSLDLNGLIIATDTPCHAFLGTLFSNSYHYYEEHSITDFIIRELTIFCNGLLSSCKGIDLIFV